MTDDQQEKQENDYLSFDGHNQIVAVRDDIIEQIVVFVQQLRADGASVPADAVLVLAEALVLIGLHDRGRVKAAVKATTVSDPSDIEYFERHFPAFWAGLRSALDGASAPDGFGPAPNEDESQPATDDDLPPDRAPDHETDDTSSDERISPSRHRPTAEKNNGEKITDEQAGAVYSAAGEGDRIDESGAQSAVDKRDLNALCSALARLEGRRWGRASGDRLDVRRALRESVTTGGIVTSIPTRRRTVSELGLCLLVDVSHSVLDSTDRQFLIGVLSRLHQEGRSTRTFLFDTDVQEVTTVFECSDGDPLTALRDAEVAWGGGTRIGKAIQTVRTQNPHAIDRDTIVVVISDGFDVGELSLLEDGMAWLDRRAAAVLWFNPLAGTEGYEPTCRGMSRALPYVDGLFAFASSDDLREIARQIDHRGIEGPIGYKHDARLLRR